MTRPRLLPVDYTEAARFEAEIATLYHRGWHFACLRRDLAQLDDYVLVRIGRREVIVQNVGSELRAFSNVCPHRFSALRTERRGRAKLRCPYHLWSFDAEGDAVSIPHRHGVELDPAATRLQRWQLEALGELVFVSLEPPAPLTDTLGPVATWLGALSANFVEEVDAFEQVIRANWKLIVQNTLEFDHAFSVHEQTFARLVQTPVALEDVAAHSPHIAYRVAMKPAPGTRSLDRKIEALFARTTPVARAGYTHALVFPSTTIGTTDNHHVSVVRYLPEAPDRTSMQVRTFLLAIPDLSPAERSLRDAVVPAELAFTRQLFEEDRVACERVQRGVEQAPSSMRGSLLPSERLVQRFQEAYCEAMRLDVAD